MPELVTYVLADGTPVRFEVDPPKGFQQVRAGDRVAGRITEAAGSVLRAAGEVVEQAKALGPEEIALNFSLKVTADAGWVIAKVGTEGNFGVTLTWRSPQGEPPEPASPALEGASGE